MTAALLLGAYAILAGWVAPAGFQRDWTARLPRLAIAQWLILSLSFVAALTMAGLAMADPRLALWASVQHSGAERPLSSGLAAADPLTTSLGFVLASGVLAQTVRHLISGLFGAARQGSLHAALVGAVGYSDPTLGAVILDHEAPSAYCVSVGRGCVVITRGAVSRLAPRQLQAVVVHEQAHIRARHHLKLGAAQALRSAFPWVPLLAHAPAELAVLVEMAADDRAAHRFDPLTVAEALIVFAHGVAPPTALTMGGPAAVCRIRRLHRASSTRSIRGHAILVLGATTLCLPAVVLLFPVAAMTCGLLTR